jgi:hypothetical protein
MTRSQLAIWMAGLLLTSAACTSSRELVPTSPRVVSSTTDAVASETSTTRQDGLEFKVPHLSEVPPLKDADLMSPTVQLMGSVETSQAFLNRIEERVGSCMQLRGWTYEPVLQDETTPQPLTVGEKRAFVATYGYGLFTNPPQGPDPARGAIEKNRQRFLELSPQDQEAYTRDRDGGVGEGDNPLEGSCLAAARAESGSILFDAVAIAEMAEMSQAARATPQSLEVDRAYAQCMSGRGYDVEVPADALRMVMNRGPTLAAAEADRLDVQVASDDFECQLATRLPWSHAVELEIVRVLVERYPEYAGSLDQR